MIMTILYIKVVQLAVKVVGVIIKYVCFVCVSVCVSVSYQVIVKQMLHIIHIQALLAFWNYP